MNDEQIAMENEYKKVYNLFSEHGYTVESRTGRGFGDTVIDIREAVEIAIDYCRESNKDGQDQALREIDIRIDELEKFNIYEQSQGRHKCFYDSNNNTIFSINSRIAELQAQKDKLIKGVE